MNMNVKLVCRILSRSVHSEAQPAIKCFDEIPTVQQLPYIGSLHLYKLGKEGPRGAHRTLSELFQKHGPIFKETIKGQTIVHTANPDDARTIYHQDGKMPNIAPLLSTIGMYRKYRNMSPGLGNSNGIKWYQLRRAANDALLKPKQVTKYVAINDLNAQNLVKQISQRIQDNAELEDLRSLIGKWSLDGSSLVCFGRGLGALDGGQREILAQKFIDCNLETFGVQNELLFSYTDLYLYMATPQWRRFVKLEDTIYGTLNIWLDEAIDEFRKLKAAGTLGSKFPYLEHLFSQSELSEDDVRILTLMPFEDALTTVTPSLLYNIYCLAKYPAAQQIFYEEIKRIIPDNQPITAKHLDSLKYARGVLKESFRFLPLIPSVSRITNVDVVLSGYHVPAQTNIDLNMFVNFFDENYFTEPLEYKPERWLGEHVKSIHPYVVLPFSHGARLCVGMRLAQQNMLIVLCRILQSYQLECLQEHILDQKFEALLFPDRPVRVKFKPRQ